MTYLRRKQPTFLLVLLLVLLLGCSLWWGWSSAPILNSDPTEGNSLLRLLPPVHVNISDILDASFPPRCTEPQLSLIAQQLPDSEAIRLQTNCPDATWLEELESSPPPKVSIFVGCNKGMDAIDMLRWASQNATIDKFKWKDALGHTDTAVCAQDAKGQAKVTSSVGAQKQNSNIHVYCIEAMPSMYSKLEQAVQKLQWQDKFHVFNYAMSRQDGGNVLFPNASRMVGVESLALKDCQNTKGSQPARWMKKFGASCVNVTQGSLDGFVKRHVAGVGVGGGGGNSGRQDIDIDIDFLSVDVEGNDWPVLLGASETLKHVSYLEFEYHEIGAWKDNYSLREAIDTLANNNKFVCYWAGREGKLWRLTNCWRRLYSNTHQWSNVACASKRRAPNLLRRMEEGFLQTLQDFKREQQLLFVERQTKQEKGEALKKKNAKQTKHLQQKDKHFENADSPPPHLAALYITCFVVLFCRFLACMDRTCNRFKLSSRSKK